MNIKEFIDRFSLKIERYEYGEAAEPIGFIDETEYGVFIQVGNLSIFNVDNCLLTRASALESTLEELYNKYPSIQIKGYVGYYWTDIHSGEAEQFTIAFPEASYDAYEFIGKTLEEKFLDDKYLDEYEDRFNEVIENDLQKFLEIIKNHKQWISDKAINNFSDKFKENKEFVTELNSLLDNNDKE